MCASCSSKHLSDHITQDQQTARAVAPSLPDTLADCARQPAQSHHRFSMVENRSRRPTAPTCVQKPRYDRIPEVSKQPASSLHRSPTLSQTVRGHGHTPTSASRQSKIGPVDQPRQHACKPRYDRISEVSKQPASSLHRLPTLSQTVRGHGHSPVSVSRQSKIVTVY
jgi:hypothetical protein